MSSIDVWRPSKALAVFFALLFGPLVFLYINRLKLFFFYLALTVGYLYLSYGPLSSVFQSISYNWQLFFLVFPVIYLIHALSEVSDWDISKPRTWYAHWLPVMSIGILLFSALVLVRVLFFEIFTTPGGSMLPTIRPGAHVFVNKQGYGHFSIGGTLFARGDKTVEPQAGDLLAFTIPDSNQVYLYRVVGLPGDTLRYSKSQLSIKKSCAVSEALCQQFKVVTDLSKLTGKSEDQYYSYVKETIGDVSYQVALTGSNNQKRFEITIPENQYFMMGDNRDHSRDSRYFGLVPREQLIGRVEHIW